MFLALILNVYSFHGNRLVNMNVLLSVSTVASCMAVSEWKTPEIH